MAELRTWRFWSWRVQPQVFASLYGDGMRRVVIVEPVAAHTDACLICPVFAQGREVDLSTVVHVGAGVVEKPEAGLGMLGRAMGCFPSRFVCRVRHTT